MDILDELYRARNKKLFELKDFLSILEIYEIEYENGLQLDKYYFRYDEVIMKISYPAIVDFKYQSKNINSTIFYHKSLDLESLKRIFPDSNYKGISEFIYEYDYIQHIKNTFKRIK